MGLMGACRTDNMKIDTLNVTTSMSDVVSSVNSNALSNFTYPMRAESDEDESASLWYLSTQDK